MSRAIFNLGKLENDALHGLLAGFSECIVEHEGQVRALYAGVLNALGAEIQRRNKGSGAAAKGIDLPFEGVDDTEDIRKFATVVGVLSEVYVEKLGYLRASELLCALWLECVEEIQAREARAHLH